MLRELESKHRAESARWKKKLEGTLTEMEKQLGDEREAKETALKAVLDAEDSYNQLVVEFEEVAHILEETKSSFQVGIFSRCTTTRFEFIYVFGGL